MTQHIYLTSGTFDLNLLNARKEKIDFDAEKMRLGIVYTAPATKRPLPYEPSDIEILQLLCGDDCIITSTSHEGISVQIEDGTEISIFFTVRHFQLFKEEICAHLNSLLPGP